jgi:hypothetical protein
MLLEQEVSAKYTREYSVVLQQYIRLKRRRYSTRESPILMVTLPFCMTLDRPQRTDPGPYVVRKVLYLFRIVSPQLTRLKLTTTQCFTKNKTPSVKINYS